MQDELLSSWKWKVQASCGQGGWNCITICEESKVQIKDTHTHKTHTPSASPSVISDRLTASAAQQLNATLPLPPSQPIESENPPVLHTHKIACAVPCRHDAYRHWPAYWFKYTIQQSRTWGQTAASLAEHQDKGLFLLWQPNRPCVCHPVLLLLILLL